MSENPLRRDFFNIPFILWEKQVETQNVSWLEPHPQSKWSVKVNIKTPNLLRGLIHLNKHFKNKITIVYFETFQPRIPEFSRKDPKIPLLFD